jgi:class 3 adenylate cyclase/tetratricopeptide (TPR) repeat protein
VCPTCSAAVPEGNRFCGQCGTLVVGTECRSCGTTNPTGQPFCGQCGAALVEAGRSSAPALEERKLATVLFADVVGFTSLAERTDPEVVARMVDAAFRQLADVIAEHGGTVDKYMGDSMMAVFGVPVAHDDDAERAVAAGLSVRALGGDLAFSIGINSGEVMATSLGHTDDITVIGDTVNVAARLEKVAAPGEVLCGRLTAELAGRRVRFRERQPVLLKGKQEPVGVWEAVALHPAGGTPVIDQRPLVGRDDELAFLAAQWRRVMRDRQPHVVLLCGEAGSGKTRLIDELSGTTGPDGTVVRVTYPAYGAMGGTRVAADAVRLLGPSRDDEVNARLRSLSGEIDPSLKAIDPAGIPKEQLWAFARLIHEKGSDRPLLLVIDDMHHAGERTLELLGDLTTRVNGIPLLTVLSGRTEPGEWLSHFPAATTVRLSALSRLDAAALANDLVGTAKPLADEAVDFLVDRTGGNPLYLRELVTMARDRGSLVDDGDRYRLAAHAAIPATLQALLAARLDALEPAQKLALQYVAVLGEAVTMDQVSGLGSPEVASTLPALADVGLLRFNSEGRYDTVDSLLREVAYETLPHNLRGELHREAAGVVKTAEERARHLDRATGYLADDETVAAEAVAALVEAGHRLIAASRHLDALRLLDRAAALGCLPTSALLELARLQAMVSRGADALRTLALIPDDPDDPTVGIERDHTAGMVQMFSDPAAALPALQDAARRWHEVGDMDKEAWAHGNAGVTCFNMSRMEESAQELERALAMFEECGDRAGAVSVSSFMCLVRPGDPRVPTWLNEALAFADASGDRTRQLNTLITLTWNQFLRSFCGRPADMAQAEGFARRLAALADELGAPEGALHGWSLLTIMARLSGRLEEAAERAVSLQRAAATSGHRNPWLGWAAGFTVTVAGGATEAAPPFPPENSSDPVDAMAQLVIEAELTMAGRVHEAIDRIGTVPRPDLGPIADLTRVFHGLALVLAGRPEEALPLVERAAAAARVLNSPTAGEAAAALRAEISRDTSKLPPPPVRAEGVTDVLVLRAHAARGDTAAAAALREATVAMVMPGLTVV